MSSDRIRPPREHRFNSDTTYLDADLTPRELTAALEDLQFSKSHPHQLVELDRDVRDFLLAAVKAKHR